MTTLSIREPASDTRNITKHEYNCYIVKQQTLSHFQLAVQLVAEKKSV